MPLDKKPLTQIDLFPTKTDAQSTPKRSRVGKAGRKLVEEELQDLAERIGDAPQAQLSGSSTTGDSSLMLAQADPAASAVSEVSEAGAGTAGGTASSTAGTAGTAGTVGTAAGVGGAAAGLSTGAMLGLGALGAAAAAGGGGGSGGSGSGGTVAGNTTVVTHPKLVITDNRAEAKLNKASGDITFTFTFDEAVSGFDASKVSVGNGYKPKSGGLTAVSDSVYTMVVSPHEDFEGDVTVDVAAGAATSKANGGASLAAAQAAQSVDTLAPTLVITDSKNGVLAKADGDITYTFTFGQAVTGFDASKVTLDHGTKGTFTKVSSTVYTLVVTPEAGMQGDMTVSVAANAALDSAGNGNQAVQAAQTVDTLAPTVTNLALDPGKASLTLTLSEHVNGFFNFADFKVLVDGNPAQLVDITWLNGNQVKLSLDSALTSGQALSVTWTNSQAGQGSSTVTDDAGNGLNGFTRATLADGYVRGASVYIDTNNNGQVDQGTDFYVGVTNDEGNFFIPQGAPTGTLIAIGGVNIDTGVPNTMPLKAPAGSTTVNPLTTLVQAVVEKSTGGGEASAQQIADAASQVATTLGITLDAGQSLTSYDPLSAGNVDAQKVAAQVATVVTLAGSADANGGSTVIDNLANSIQTAGSSGSGAVVSLSDSNTLSSVLANVNTTAQQQSTIADAATTIGNATSLTEVSAAQSQFLDLIAPEAPLLSAAAVTNDNTPRVRVTLNTTDTSGKAVIAGDKLVLLENGVEISGTVVLSAADVKAGFIEVDANLLADGAHTIQAVLVDQAGNRSNAALGASVIVDTLAPQAPVLAGAIATDYLINASEAQAGVVISGSAEAGSTVQLTAGGFTRSATANGAGLWTTTLSAADVASIGQGAKTLSVVATDAAGNVSSPSTASFNVDTLAPGATVTITQALDNVEPTGNVASGGSSNDNTLELSGAVSGAANGDVVAIYDGATRLGTASINAGTWSFTTPSLSNATHALTARVEDAAGNAGTASSVYSVNVNATVPTATVSISAVTDDVPGGAPSVLANGATNDNTPTLSGVISGNFGPSDSVVIYDGSTRLGLASVSGNSWSYTPGNAVTDGVHSFTAVVENIGGNQGSASAAFMINVDTVAPNAPTVAKVAGDDVVNLAEKNAGVVVSGTAQSGATVNISWGSASKSVVATNGSWSASFASGEVPTDGSNVVVNASDAAGNVSANTTKTVTVDASAPDAPVFNAIAGDNKINAAEATAGTVISGTAESLAKVALTLATGNVKQITATEQGGWSYTLSAADIAAIGQGQNKTLSVTATDQAGNLSAAGTTTITIDTVAPTLTPVALQAASDSGVKGDGRSNATSPVLEFTAEANSTLWADWGNGSFVNTGASGTGAPQTLSVPVQAMSQDGSYTFRLKAVDSAGNESSARTLNYTRDTSAPVQTQISAVEDDVGAVRGVLANNGVTDDTQLLVRGTAEAFSKVQVLNGSTVLGSATADAKGGWSLLTSTLANGSTYNLKAVATDAAGNVGEASAAVVVTVDTVAPTAPVIANVATDNLVNAVEKGNGVTVSGTAEAGSTVVVSWGGISHTVIATGGNWNASFTANEVPIDGPGSISAVATDAAGNASIAGTRAVSVDSVKPGTPVINDVAVDNVVNLAEKSAGVVVSGTAEAGSSVLVSWGASSKTATADDIGHYSVSFSANEVPADADASSISAVATDAAGNASTARTVTVSIDSSVPSVTLAISAFEDNAPSSNVEVLGSGAITNDNTPTLVGTLAGSLGANERIAIYENGARIGYAEVDQQGGWRFTTPVADNGSHTYSARVEDAAGNAGASSASFSLTVDATPPASVATISNISDDVGRIRSTVQSGGASDDALPTLQGTIVGTSQPGDIVKVYDNGVLLGSANVNGASWSFTPQAPLPEGSHNFTAVVENAAGTSSVPSIAFVYTLDLSAPSAPTITSVLDDTEPQAGTVANGGSTNDSTLQLQGKAAANTLVEVVEGNTVLGSATADANGNWSLTTSTLNAGQHVLAARAIDTVGNVSGASDTHTVMVDLTPPAMPQVAAVAVDNVVNASEKAAGVSVSGSAEGNAVVSVSWGNAAQTTQADAQGNWSVKFNAGQLPQDGSSAIQVSASDAAGNVSAVANVNVSLDTSAPAAPVIASVTSDNQVNASEKNAGVSVQGTAEALSSVTLSWGAASKTVNADSSGNWTASFSGQELPADGSSTISAVAKDAAGNSSTAGTRGVNIDTSAPSGSVINVVAGNDIVSGQEKAAGVTVSGKVEANAAISVSWGGNIQTGTADADGNWSFDFSTSQIPADGAGQITLTVSDAAGNSSSISRAVTVAATGPANTAQISAILDDAPGGASNLGNNGIGNDDSPLLQGSYSGTLPNGAVIAVFDGATRLGNATLGTDNQWSFQVSSLNAGAHNFSVCVVDVNGNAGNLSTTFAYTLDLAAPGTPQIQALTGDNVINASEQSAVLTGSAEPLSTVSLNLGGQTRTVNTNASGAWTYTLNADDVAALMEDGSISAVAQDAAGNSSQAAGISVSVDLSAPQVQVLEAPSGLKLMSSEAGKVFLNGVQIGVVQADQPSTLSAQGSASLGQLSVVDAAGNAGQAGTAGLGSAAGDVIDGRAQTDRLALYGFEGNDSLTGGKGNDVLVGGAGDDSIEGGGGVDTAYFELAPGSDSPLQYSLDGEQVLVMRGDDIVARITRGASNGSFQVMEANGSGFGNDTVSHVQRLDFVNSGNGQTLSLNAGELDFLLPPVLETSTTLHIDWTLDRSEQVLLAGDSVIRIQVHFSEPISFTGSPLLNLTVVDDAGQTHLLQLGAQAGATPNSLDFVTNVPADVSGRYHISGFDTTQGKILTASGDMLADLGLSVSNTGFTADHIIYAHMLEGLTGTAGNDLFNPWMSNPEDAPKTGDFSGINGGAGNRDLLVLPVLLAGVSDEATAASYSLRYVVDQNNVRTVQAYAADGTPLAGSALVVPANASFPANVEGLAFHVVYRDENGDVRETQNAPLLLYRNTFSATDPVAPDDIFIQGSLGSDTITVNDSDTSHRYLIRASTGNDTIVGHAGVDVVFGEGGNDSISTGDGNDRIFIGGGNDTVDGGNGDDAIVINLPGQHLTVVGGPSGMVLVSHTGFWMNDQFVDTAPARAAYVVNFNDAGQMTVLDLAAGTTTLASNVEKLEVRMLGGDERHTLSFNSGTGNADVLQTQDGTPILVGLAGDDDLSAGERAAMLFGSGGNDTLRGGSGNDILAGGSESDLLLGGWGDDTLAGEAGDDMVDGGDGFDRAAFLVKADGIGPIDKHFDEGQNAWIVTQGVNALAKITQGSNGALVVQDLAAGPGWQGFGTDTVMNVENLSFAYRTSVLSFNASELTFIQQPGQTHIDWTQDNSSLVLIAGDEQLQFLVHFNNLVWVNGTPVLNLSIVDGQNVQHVQALYQPMQNGGGPITTLHFSFDIPPGTRGQYHIDGLGLPDGASITDAQVDFLPANLAISASSTITAGGYIYPELLANGSGANDVIGIYEMDPASVPTNGNFTGVDGGAGDRDLLGVPLVLPASYNSQLSVAGVTMRYVAAANGVPAHVIAIDASGNAIPGVSVDVPSTYPQGVEALAYHLVFQTADGYDSVPGNPLILTRAVATWNDPINTNDFYVQGTLGNDSIDVSSDTNANHRYLIRASVGNDTLIGHNGSDVLVGEGGNDSMSGGDGNDRLFVSGGSDTLDGGADFDRLAFNLPGQDVRLNGFLSGVGLQNLNNGNAGPTSYILSADDNGVLRVTNFSDRSQVSTAANMEALELRMTGADQRVEVALQKGGAGNDVIDNSSGARAMLMGGSGDDQLHASFYGDVMFGGSGNDTLQGGYGDDYLYGDAGNDMLRGDGGTNFLVGGAGNDTVIGGYLGGDTAGFAVKGSGALALVHDAAADAYFVTQNGVNAARLFSSGGGWMVQDLTDLVNGFGSDLVTGVSKLLFGNATGQSLVVDVQQLTPTAGKTEWEIPVHGTPNNDTLIAGNWDAHLYGEGGNDTLTGGGSFTILEGGDGADSLVGGTGETDFRGGAGDDILDSTVGTGYAVYEDVQTAVTVNLATGTASGLDIGSDTLIAVEGAAGGAGNDTLTGGNGNDSFAGNGGNDVIDGGAGVDTVYYESAKTGVTVNLSGGNFSQTGNLPGGSSNSIASGVAYDGLGGTDTLVGTAGLISIENIVGSDFGDLLLGSNVANHIDGGHGADTIRGNGGNDTLDGGVSALPGLLATQLSEFDWVDYRNASSVGGAVNGVTVNLNADSITGYGSATGAAPSSNGTSAFSHQLKNFEAVFGSNFNDSITGDANSNMLRGGAGNDTINGGDGLDWADYLEATVAGVDADLGAGTAVARAGGSSGTDRLISIERLRGSNFDDSLLGDNGNNLFRAMGGNNVVDGGGGVDLIDYVQAAAGVTVDMSVKVNGAFTVANVNYGNGVTGTDVVSNVEGVQGTRFNDSIKGDANDNIFVSFGGNDSIDGGAQGSGGDTVNYQFATDALNVNLAAGSASVKNWGTDQLSNIENITGTEYNDNITGNDANNLLNGGNGNDVLDGGLGDDTLIGGAGSDTITGGGGNDTIDLGVNGFGNFPGSVVKMNSLDEGTDTVSNFSFNDPSFGGDVIDLSNIAHLGSNAKVQQFYDAFPQGSATLNDNNVFIFNNTAMTQDQAKQMVADAANVNQQEGYLIFKDADHGGQATIFHSADLANGGALQALIVLSGTVDLQMLHQTNLIL